ncbi:MAG: hypothetical protein LBB50_02855 [Oscillospiraceae bacterium]|jgi:hypothetical protein|nr:hypothetical protein [Oscillospiraceae bacterium]
MARKDGDFFRTVHIGGFHKSDVMRYIEQQEQRLHGQTQVIAGKERQLCAARREQLRWMHTARWQRQRSAAADRVQRELRDFQRQLAAAQVLTEEVEHENYFLREKIRALEESPIKEEPPSVPLEQLTFQYFLEELEGEEGDTGEFAHL